MANEKPTEISLPDRIIQWASGNALWSLLMWIVGSVIFSMNQSNSASLGPSFTKLLPRLSREKSRVYIGGAVLLDKTIKAAGSIALMLVGLWFLGSAVGIRFKRKSRSDSGSPMWLRMLMNDTDLLQLVPAARL